MTPELSHGLAGLSVSGNMLRDSQTGKQVTLKGVVRSGLEYSSSDDLQGFPLPDVDGIVYSTYIYPNKSAGWDQAFGALASIRPVFAGEWGGEPEDLAWSQRLADYLGAKQIGWTAWSWSDAPRLVQLPPGPPYLPTEFGELVRRKIWGG